MATMLAHIIVRRGAEREFEAVAAAMFVDTHGLEDGVRAYEFWRGTEPQHYYLMLSYDDFLAFIAHQVSDHHEAASPKLGALMESIRLEWVDPVGGASTFGPTNLQATPDSADELSKRYAVRFAAQIAGWWLPLRSPNLA